MTSLNTCQTLYKHKIIVSLSTVPLSVLHTAFASFLTSTGKQVLSYQAKQKITDPWVQISKPVWQLLAHSKSNPFSYNPWDTGQRLWWGGTQNLSSLFTVIIMSIFKLSSGYKSFWANGDVQNIVSSISPDNREFLHAPLSRPEPCT